MLEIKSWRDDARRGLNREKDLIQDRSEEVNAYDHLLDAVDELISDNDDLADELERQQQEIDDLNEQLEQKDAEVANMRQQMLEEKERRLASETKLSELSKLTAGVAKKSSQDDMIKAMRSYLNISKRKTQGKREAAKMVFMEMLSNAKLELPDDIMELLEHLLTSAVLTFPELQLA